MNNLKIYSSYLRVHVFYTSRDDIMSSLKTTSKHRRKGRTNYMHSHRNNDIGETAVSSDSSKRKKKPPEKRLFHAPVTPGKIAVYCFLAVMVAAAFILGRFIYVTVINPRAAFADPTPPPIQTLPAATAAPGQSTPPPTQTLSPEEQLAAQADMDFMKDRVNVLLTGIDYAAEREGRTDFRTDTILLISVDFATGRADMLSVPRDSYADIAYTTSRWKINGAYMSAGGKEGNGFACLMDTVSDAVGGIPVNYYLAVEMQAVKDIVDIIGGVWYDVDYEINMNGRHLDKGYQLLSGQSVLDYCRARKGITSGTDIDRIDRQQRLLMEVFNQLKDAKQLPKIPQIYQTMQSQIYTNLNFEQIAALALFALDLDLETECSRYTLKGEYMPAYNATYYVLDHNYTKEVIEKMFGVDQPDIDWTYSIGYVRLDMALQKLTAAMNNLNTLMQTHIDMLPQEMTNEAERLAAAAQALQDEAAVLLQDPKTTKDIEDTENYDAMLQSLQEMYATMNDYIENPPAPSPTPTVPPTQAPTEEPTEEPPPDESPGT